MLALGIGNVEKTRAGHRGRTVRSSSSVNEERLWPDVSALRHQRDYRTDLYDNPERGQRTSQPVGQNRSQGDAKCVEQAQRSDAPAGTGTAGAQLAPLSSMIFPSRMRMVRRAYAATSASCVTNTTVSR